MQLLVIDTNVVLDMFLFGDPRAQGIRQAVQERQVEWIATSAMRDELMQVLQSQAVATWTARRAGATDDNEDTAVLFDAQARLVPAAAPAPCACRDADDQKFVDLAVAHSAWLLSRDRDILALRRRLRRLGVRTGASWQDVQDRAG